MPGSWGNENLYHAAASAFIDYSSSSESVTLPVGTVAVSLYATTKCWVRIGQPGETAVAAAPGAEKTFVQRTFPVEPGMWMDFPAPMSTDAKLVQVAVIRASADGTLDVVARKP